MHKLTFLPSPEKMSGADVAAAQHLSGILESQIWDRIWAETDFRQKALEIIAPVESCQCDKSGYSFRITYPLFSLAEDELEQLFRLACGLTYASRISVSTDGGFLRSILDYIDRPEFLGWVLSNGHKIPIIPEWQALTNADDFDAVCRTVKFGILQMLCKTRRRILSARLKLDPSGDFSAADQPHESRLLVLIAIAGKLQKDLVDGES